MAPRIEAIVKSELLIWARENAGLSIEEAAKKVPVKPERLKGWELGEGRPTVPQLRKLGKAYKRPLAVFFLSKPPKKFKAMRDFRRLPGEIAGVESPKLRVEIRYAQYRREVAIELYQELEGLLPEFTATANISEDPENLATRIRELLKITYPEQIKWSQPYDPLNHWRAAFEEIGVLVFQASGISLGEMRGFSISDTPLPTIVVNTKDAPNGRTFSMLHEFVHIMLRTGGLCDLDESAWRPPEEQKVEVFCNHVAGAVLVPEEYLLLEQIVSAQQEDKEWSDEEIEGLARKYSVSRETLLRRLLITGCTTQAFYERKREEYKEEYRARALKGRAGFAPPAQIAVSNAGHLFTRLVLNSYYQENISLSSLSSYLDVRVKHLPKIEQTIFGQTVEFGAVS